jgi:hypothetical protein
MWLLKFGDSLGASSKFSTLNVASPATLFVLLSLWKHVIEGSLQGGSMYPYKFAAQHPERAAFVMADSGQSVSYAEFEMRPIDWLTSCALRASVIKIITRS